MPLLIICGYPSSGKTVLAGKLKKYFEEEKQKTVFLVSEDNVVGKEKNEIYADSKKEKPLRSALRGDVERYISRETVLILDGLNYIKSFRYELHCIVKAEKTLHSVVYCGMPQDICWKWNKNRSIEQQYTKEIFDNLISRFEIPDGRNRWDSPLFTVLHNIETNFEDIFDGLYSRKAPPPNQSTLPTPASSGDFMRNLDLTTQAVITEILDYQKTAMVGDTIKISGTTEKVTLLKILNMADLRRIKRQFITYAKMHPVEDVSKIRNMFVQFLKNSFY